MYRGISQVRAQFMLKLRQQSKNCHGSVASVRETWQGPLPPSLDHYALQKYQLLSQIIFFCLKTKSLGCIADSSSRSYMFNNCNTNLKTKITISLKILILQQIVHFMTHMLLLIKYADQIIINFWIQVHVSISHVGCNAMRSWAIFGSKKVNYSISVFCT